MRDNKKVEFFLNNCYKMLLEEIWESQEVKDTSNRIYIARDKQNGALFKQDCKRQQFNILKIFRFVLKIGQTAYKCPENVHYEGPFSNNQTYDNHCEPYLNRKKGNLFFVNRKPEV